MLTSAPVQCLPIPIREFGIFRFGVGAVLKPLRRPTEELPGPVFRRVDRLQNKFQTLPKLICLLAYLHWLGLWKRLWYEFVCTQKSTNQYDRAYYPLWKTQPHEPSKKQDYVVPRRLSAAAGGGRRITTNSPQRTSIEHLSKIQVWVIRSIEITRKSKIQSGISFSS